MKLYRAHVAAVISAAAAAAASVAQAGPATLVDHQTYTTDTTTGLDWLDLTETNGLSYDTVVSRLGAGQQFAGWRFASKAEVISFWINAGGIAPFSGAAQGETDWVGQLQGLWGKTYPFVYTVQGYTVQGTIAMTSDQSATCASCNLTVYLLNNIDASDSSVGDFAEAQQLNEAYRDQGQVPIGHALVRESATSIPEPTTFALVGAALFGVAATRRRRAAN